MAKNDAVHHPEHYTSHPSGIECIDITRHMGFNLGNAIKYIWRCDLKHDNSTQDLRKALWYIEDEINKRMIGSLESPACEATKEQIINFWEDTDGSI